MKISSIFVAFLENTDLCFIFIFIFSIIFNIPHFFELKTEMKPMNETHFNESIGENITLVVLKPQVAPTELRDNLDYSRDYVLIANSVALVFIPILTLIILNSFIFRTISQATRRHNEISSQQRRDNSVRRKETVCLLKSSPSTPSVIYISIIPSNIQLLIVIIYEIFFFRLKLKHYEKCQCS